MLCNRYHVILMEYFDSSYDTVFNHLTNVHLELSGKVNDPYPFLALKSQKINCQDDQFMLNQIQITKFNSILKEKLFSLFVCLFIVPFF